MSYMIEADKRLLKFKSYDEYLDSLVSEKDLDNLRSTNIARSIAELGYRSAGETLSRNDFYERLATVTEAVYPTHRPYVSASEGLKPTDPFLQQLALRERLNRLGILATIIFLRHFTKRGFEISGYIDFSHRLNIEDWVPFFEGKLRLWPREDDLAYFHWRNNQSFCNSSPNFKVSTDPVNGLLFHNRKDHKSICINPYSAENTNNTRTRIYSDKYDQVVLYDHVVRKKYIV